MRKYKLIVLGSGGVGKSALTVQFVSGEFVERYDPTLQDIFRKEIDGGSPTVLEILDTAGTEQFADLRGTYRHIMNSQGVLLVYSIIDPQTFIDVQPLRDMVLRLKDGVVPPIVLVGNKCDLEAERSVTTRDGEMLAAEWSCLFFETSAKTSFNVQEMFAEIVRQICKKKTKESSNCCSCCCCTVL